MARLGSSPITTGNTKVAPNIATTCWAPIPTVLPQGRRSSGATGSPGAGVTSRQLNIVDIWFLLTVKGTEHLSLVTTSHTPTAGFRRRNAGARSAPGASPAGPAAGVGAVSSPAPRPRILAVAMPPR